MALLIVVLNCKIGTAPVIQVLHHLVAEIQTRRNPQVEVIGKAEVGQHIHTETRRVRRHVGIPLKFFIYNQTVVGNGKILKIQAHREAEVNLLDIGIGAIQNHVIVLGMCDSTSHQQQQYTCNMFQLSRVHLTIITQLFFHYCAKSKKLSACRHYTL